LHDVSTLYFETDKADGFLELGVLQGTPTGATDHDRAAHRRLGVPVDGRQAFEGNKAETKTMIPTLKSFMATHQLADITDVADAGMSPKPTRTRSRTSD